MSKSPAPGPKRPCARVRRMLRRFQGAPIGERPPIYCEDYNSLEGPDRTAYDEGILEILGPGAAEVRRELLELKVAAARKKAEKGVVTDDEDRTLDPIARIARIALTLLGTPKLNDLLVNIIAHLDDQIAADKARIAEYEARIAEYEARIAENEARISAREAAGKSKTKTPKGGPNKARRPS